MVRIRVAVWLLTAFLWVVDAAGRVAGMDRLTLPWAALEPLALLALAASLWLLVGAMALRGPTAALVDGLVVAAAALAVGVGYRVDALIWLATVAILAGLAALALLAARRRRWDATAAFLLVGGGLLLADRGGGALVAVAWLIFVATHRGRRLPLPATRR